MFFKAKRILPLIGLFWIGLVLVACTQMAGEATPTVQAVSSRPSTTPTASLTPTITPDPGVISPANVNQIVLLSHLNKGRTEGAPIFSPDGKWLYQASSLGVYKYDTATYSQVTLLASLSGTSTYSFARISFPTISRENNLFP